MIKLTFAIPSTGNSSRLWKQWVILSKVLKISSRYNLIEVDVYFSLNCSMHNVPRWLQEFSSNVIQDEQSGHAAVRFSCNGENLGYDKNIVQCVLGSSGHYIHFLSDNDYLPVAYFVSLFEAMSALDGTALENDDRLPVQILPVGDSFGIGVPGWHRLIVPKIIEAVTRRNFCDLFDFVDQSSAVLFGSQISNCIVRNDLALRQSLYGLIHGDRPCELGDIAQSVYLWAVIWSYANRTGCAPTLLPFAWRGKSVSVPYLSRSLWFYRSTLERAPMAYCALESLIREVFGIQPIGFQLEHTKAIASYIAGIGKELLLRDFWRYPELGHLIGESPRPSLKLLLIKIVSLVSYLKQAVVFNVMYLNLLRKFNLVLSK